MTDGVPIGVAESWFDIPGGRVLIRPLLPRELVAASAHNVYVDDGEREVDAAGIMLECLRLAWIDAEGVKCDRKKERGVKMVTLACIDELSIAQYTALVSIVNEITAGLSNEQADELVFTADSPAQDLTAGESKADVIADSESV